MLIDFFLPPDKDVLDHSKLMIANPTLSLSLLILKL